MQGDFIMIDKLSFGEALACYKKTFVKKQWAEEKYKWEAVKCFQDNWDIDADDFAEMLTRSLSKTFGLLSSSNNFPANTISILANEYPEEVRGMFIKLFDESQEIIRRIFAFKVQSSVLWEKYGKGSSQHFQTENAITTYLWLRYPDKHYIYRFSEASNASEELGSNCRFVRGKDMENLRNYLSMYNEIHELLDRDNELKEILRNHLTDSCYSDPKLVTVTVDFFAFLTRYFRKNDDSEYRAEGFSLPKNRYITGYSRNNVQSTSADVSVNEYEKYTKQDFLNEVFMTDAGYDRLVSVLKRKKNIILQGAPGVGKTYTAKRLAWSVMGVKDEGRIEFVQFHQSYCYEDFIMGYKPSEEGFKLVYGAFWKFCRKAADDPDNDYFFIIDEINRGNMSKIFGELLMLIESDYRGKEITMSCGEIKFSVPERLHIIGMMNTADRSLAIIDYALRRRFSFFEIAPGFDSDGFIKYSRVFDSQMFDSLISKIKELNMEITADRSLGKGFCIGHSYFCGAEKCTSEWLKDIVDFEILPMLEEYWFDDRARVERWEEILHGVFK